MAGPNTEATARLVTRPYENLIEPAQRWKMRDQEGGEQWSKGVEGTKHEKFKG